MSTTIDQRIVEMRFDNKQFESNVQTSLSTIGRLKESLNFSGAFKGLENIGSAISRVNFSGLKAGVEDFGSAIDRIDMSGFSSGVESVGLRFSALDVLAVTILSRIADAAITAGKIIATALTIEPIIGGFSEYETQINSVQTIMGNTGKDVQTVNDALDQLNTYADQTIYDFATMTKNAGMFTAAGVGLDDTMVALKGIGNWAAFAGAGTEDMSRATYQLGQALSTGTIRLIDWVSVEHTAGMGGEKYRQAFMETARQHGIDVDSMVAKDGSFRESLKEDWLTTDIFIETMQRFADDQSMTDAATKIKTLSQLMSTLREALGTGWGSTWRIIVGDFEEAKQLYTDIYNVLGGMISASANARNEVLSDWKKLGGRTDIIDALRNSFEGVLSIVKPISEAFREIFPPITAQQLAGFSEGLKNLTEHFKLSDTQAQNLKSTFEGLFSIIKVGVDVVLALAGITGKLLGGLLGFGDGVLGITGVIGEFLTGITNSTNGADAFIKAVGENFKFPGFEGFNAFLEKIQNGLSTLFDFLEKVKDKLADAFSKFDKNPFSGRSFGLLDFVNGLSLGTAALAINKFVKATAKPIESFKDTISKVKETVETLGGLTKIVDGVTGILDSVRGCLEAYQQRIKAGTLLTIAVAIAVLAGSIVALSAIPADKLMIAMAALGGAFAELLVAMKIFGKIGDKITSSYRTVALMIGIASAVRILAGAMKEMSDLEWDGVLRGLVGIGGMMAIMSGSVKYLSKNSGTMLKGADNLLIFATAIKILTQACENLAGLSVEGVIKGVGGVGALMAATSLFVNKTEFTPGLLKASAGILVFSVAIRILANACAVIGGLSIEGVIKGIAGVSALLTGVALFVNKTEFTPGLLKASAGILVFSVAIRILANACAVIGGLSIEGVVKGITGVSALLTGVALFVNKTEFTPGLLKASAGILVFSVAIRILSDACAVIGGLSIEGVIKGIAGVSALLTGVALFVNKTEFTPGLLKASASVLVFAVAMKILASAVSELAGRSMEEIVGALAAMGGALLIFSVGLEAMEKGLPGAGALLVAAAAISVLAPALSLLGALSMESIVNGLLAIIGVITIFAAAAGPLEALLPAMLGLAAVLAVLGASILAAGMGITALATGFGLLSTMGAEAAQSAATAFAVIVTEFAKTIPLLLAKLAEGIVAFCGVIIENAPTIAQAVVVVVQQVIIALVTTIPLVVAGIIQLITALLEAIAQNMPSFIQSGVDVVVAFANGVATAVPQLVDAGFKAIITFLNGMADAIRENTGPLIDAMHNLSDAMIDAFIMYITGRTGDASKAGSGVVNDGLVPGMRGQQGNVESASSDLMGSAESAMNDHKDNFDGVGGNLVQGLINGITGGRYGVMAAAAGVAADAWQSMMKELQEKSPSKKTEEIGINADLGLVNGLVKFGGMVADSAGGVAKTALSSMSQALSRASDVLTAGVDMQPTIRPVLDLSNIQNGANAIDGIIGQRTLSLAGSVSADVSTGRSMADAINDAVKTTIETMSRQNDELSGSNGAVYKIEVPVVMEGREIARVSAPYTQKELDRYNKINSMLGGVSR